MRMNLLSPVCFQLRCFRLSFLSFGVRDEADMLNHADLSQGSTNPAWAWPSPSSVPGNLTSFIKDLLFATAVQKIVS